MRSQIAITGAGHSGLLPTHLLNQAGVATVILEMQGLDHVMARIPAVALEWSTTKGMRAVGVGERIGREGKPHHHIHFTVNKTRFEIGSYGVRSKTIPVDRRKEFEKVYPFGSIFILSRMPLVPQHMVCVASACAFALCSMRSAMLSRHYVPVPLNDRVEDWNDDRSWNALIARVPDAVLDGHVTGTSIEKANAPLHSLLSGLMRWGRLLPCGDPAQIVSPTGAEGLNLAVSSVFDRLEALIEHFAKGRTGRHDGCSAQTLDRVWKAMRFSCQLTMMIHRFQQDTRHDRHMQGGEHGGVSDQSRRADGLGRNRSLNSLLNGRHARTHRNASPLSPLRHTACARRRAQGRPRSSVCQLAGHRSAAMGQGPSSAALESAAYSL